jgi:hypothetical protein
VILAIKVANFASSTHQCPNHKSIKCENCYNVENVLGKIGKSVV